MFAILVHRFDPETIFFLQKYEDEETVIYNTYEEAENVINNHILKDVTSMRILDIQGEEIL